jgi:hypothetical protein
MLLRSAALLLTASAFLLFGSATAAPPPVDFNYDIRPILSAKCYACHGQDEAARKAKLRLDVREDALREHDDGTPIVPGDTKASALVQRITSHDPEEVMPPPKEGQPLTAREIDLLSRWIAQGAEYKQHWAWQAPVRPPLPAGGTNAKNGKNGNPIDAFVVARLQAAGLHASPEADRHTLLRRVSLDLTGLPPSPEEVAAFAGDTGPEAYERAVDRLLASPRFGEKWARMWLDLARYADSTGYGSDALRLNIWPYRDWVIQAFNRNLPYDQFTIEQLAGDLLPNATQDQLIATAFHRNTMTNIEGGTVDEEYRVAAVKDRIATTAQVWMGLTLQCAQCHTHKFDPISQREYYQTYAIFNETEDADRKDEAPTLPLPPTAEDIAREAALKAGVADAEQQLKTAQAASDDGLEKWEAGFDKSKASADVAAILGIPPEQRDAAQKKKLLEYHRTLTPALADLDKKLAAKRKELAAFKPLAVPVMRELAADKRRETHLLTKGNYLAPAELLQPAVLTAFGPVPETPAPTRLDFAQWLVSPENPLTARVAVNRFWAQLFGTGIVETEEDFGTQGALPSHPELLDWLAVTFRSSAAEGGLAWDMKALLKLIVTSATYRQSSRVLPEHLEKDARNRLLAHYPRRRLEAEQLRDQALAVAGLLSPKLGGPSVYPPQPEGLWRVAFNGGENAYKTSTGEDRYRRGLYTIWRRTMPYPSMTTFDAPSRESCTLRRQPTNTPLQAFVTLNDPCFVECAQAFARRIVKEGGATAEERVKWALETALARPATEAQVASLARLFEAELAHYKEVAADATKLATSATQPLPAGADPVELAAWTVVANTVLNLDAFLTKS